MVGVGGWVGVEEGGGTAAETSLDTADAGTCPHWRHASRKCPAAAAERSHTRAHAHKGTDRHTFVPLSLRGSLR